ncbi:MAG: caspase family protein, partial [Myxococcota bacterium]
VASGDQSRHILILDACRNDPFRGLFRGATRRGLGQMGAASGVFIASSTASGAFALDGRGQNSPYSAALAVAMRTPGLKLEDVFKRVRTRVRVATRRMQIPWETSSFEGDFYFTAPLQKDERTAAELLSVAEATENRELLRYVIRTYPQSNAARAATHQLERAGVAPEPSVPSASFAIRLQRYAQALYLRAQRLGTAEAFELVAELYPDTESAKRALARLNQLPAETRGAQLKGERLVAELERELFKAGCFHEAPDATFDRRTAASLRAFAMATGTNVTWHAPTVGAFRSVKSVSTSVPCRGLPSATSSSQRCFETGTDRLCRAR